MKKANAETGKEEKNTAKASVWEVSARFATDIYW